MNITKTPITGFQPFNLVIQVTSQQDHYILCALFGLDQTIPDAVQRNSSITPTDEKRLSEMFTRAHSVLLDRP